VSAGRRACASAPPLTRHARHPSHRQRQRRAGAGNDPGRRAPARPRRWANRRTPAVFARLMTMASRVVRTLTADGGSTPPYGCAIDTATGVSVAHPYARAAGEWRRPRPQSHHPPLRHRPDAPDAPAAPGRRARARRRQPAPTFTHAATPITGMT